MPSQSKSEKVHVSFTNWMLGGSLISVTSEQSTAKTNNKKMVIVEVDSDGNEITPKKKNENKSKDDSDDERKKDAEKPSEGGGDGSDKEKPKLCKKHEAEQNAKNSNSNKDGDKKDEKDNGGWTQAQDRTIKDMKSNNKSLKAIAMEVGASKKDCTERYKILQKQDQSDSETAQNIPEDENPFANIDWDNIEVKLDEKGAPIMPDFGALFPDDEDIRAFTPKDKNQGGQKHNSNNKGNKHEFCGGKKQPQQRYEGEQQQCHNPNCNHGSGQQQKGRLQPDHIWPREDCEILEYLEARYEEHKWLHMQAGFFNWTDRMVISDMIERKFKDDGAL